MNGQLPGEGTTPAREEQADAVPTGNEPAAAGSCAEDSPGEASSTEACDRRPSRVVAVANQKGGVGKTTTVINLAACLAERDLRVLVVDLDPQANATSGLGLPRQEGSSLYGALLGLGSAEGLIQKTAIEALDIIPSELDLAGAEVDVARSSGYLHCFGNALRPVVETGAYDFIFVDCPPSLGILTMNALTAAHAMIVPLQCEYYALEGLSVITRLVNQLGRGPAGPGIELEGILMTMYDARTNLSAEVVEEVRRHFGRKVYETVIPRNVRISEAPSFGQPVILHDAHSKGAKAYRDFAEEFLAGRDLSSAVSGSQPPSPAASVS